MIKKFIRFIFVCCLVTDVTLTANACTTMIVTKGASADGHTYVTHSNDTFSSDPNIVYVPAQNHTPGSLRPVYPSAIAWDDYPELNCLSVPRLVAPKRSKDYASSDKPKTIPLGFIPQVEHTYAYLDSDYGIMNEKGLMLGECTNNGSILEYLEPAKGKNLFYASELGRVALERCTTAQEAIKLMGELIDTYGIWGTGETLLVADQNEGWVLEMQPEKEGTGYWIAQRVPDGEVFATANIFRIRDIIPGNPKQIFNPSLPEKLRKAGYAVINEPAGHVDWAASIKTVEDFHPYFALRRVWRAEMLVAPSMKLPSKIESPITEAYPFSVRPDKRLTLNDIKAIHRDVLKDTDFDVTQKPDAGLFQSPYRYKNNVSTERPINYVNTAYTWINQSKSSTQPSICWLALNTPRDNVFVPFMVAEMPASYTNVDRHKYDVSKMWWSAERVSALTKGYYSVLSPSVLKQAELLEDKSQQLINDYQELPVDQLQKLLKQNAIVNKRVWDKLFTDLLVRLDQGHGITYPQELKGDEVTKY